MKLLSGMVRRLLLKRADEIDSLQFEIEELNRAYAKMRKSLVEQCDTLNDACQILAVRAQAKPVELNQLGVRLTQEQVDQLNEAGGKFDNPAAFDDIRAIMRASDRGKATEAKFRILKTRFRSLEAYIFGMTHALHTVGKGNKPITSTDMDQIREAERTLRAAHGSGMEMRP